MSLKMERLFFDNGDKSLVYTSIDFFNLNCSSKIAPYIPTLKEKYLQVGNVVKLRNNKKGFVLPDRLIFKDCWGILDRYDENLIHTPNNEYDVVEVFENPIRNIYDQSFAWNFEVGSNHFLVPIWKREEKSAQQLEIERIESEMRKLSEAQNKLADELSKVKNCK